MEELHEARKREKHYWNVQTMQSKKRLRVVGFSRMESLCN